MALERVAVTFDVPVALAGPGTAEHARRLLVLDAVRTEQMSWRAAAGELEMGLAEFLDLAQSHGVPVVRYELADWQQEAATLERIAQKRPPAE